MSDALVRLLGIAWMLGWAISSIASPLTSQATSTGLVDAPGVALVRGHCSACHGLQLVVSQRGDRKFWLKLIRWMQAEHNLWPLPPAHEEVILNYLAEHYAQRQWSRRPALPAELMPR